MIPPIPRRLSYRTDFCVVTLDRGALEYASRLQIRVCRTSIATGPQLARRTLAFLFEDLRNPRNPWRVPDVSQRLFSQVAVLKIRQPFARADMPVGCDRSSHVTGFAIARDFEAFARSLSRSAFDTERPSVFGPEALYFGPSAVSTLPCGPCERTPRFSCPLRTSQCRRSCRAS